LKKLSSGRENPPGVMYCGPDVWRGDEKDPRTRDEVGRAGVSGGMERR